MSRKLVFFKKLSLETFFYVLISFNWLVTWTVKYPRVVCMTWNKKSLLQTQVLVMVTKTSGQMILMKMKLHKVWTLKLFHFKLLFCVILIIYQQSE